MVSQALPAQDLFSAGGGVAALFGAIGVCCGSCSTCSAFGIPCICGGWPLSCPGSVGIAPFPLSFPGSFLSVASSALALQISGHAQVPIIVFPLAPPFSEQTLFKTQFFGTLSFDFPCETGHLYVFFASSFGHPAFFAPVQEDGCSAAASCAFFAVAKIVEPSTSDPNATRTIANAKVADGHFRDLRFARRECIGLFITSSLLT